MVNGQQRAMSQNVAAVWVDAVIGQLVRTAGRVKQWGGNGDAMFWRTERIVK